MVGAVRVLVCRTIGYPAISSFSGGSDVMGLEQFKLGDRYPCYVVTTASYTTY